MITLQTKDPARNGNAILYGTEPSKFTGEQLMLVETDFGNKMRLTNNELNELFIMGRPRNYQEWLTDRRLLQMKEPD